MEHRREQSPYYFVLHLMLERQVPQHATLHCICQGRLECQLMLKILIFI